MAYQIIETCVNCWACEPLCPSQAIYAGRPHFLIDARQCTECEGDHADPQCVSISPIEGVILNPFGEAANPPASRNPPGVVTSSDGGDPGEMRSDILMHGFCVAERCPGEAVPAS